MKETVTETLEAVDTFTNAVLAVLETADIELKRLVLESVHAEIRKADSVAYYVKYKNGEFGQATTGLASVPRPC